MILQEKMTIVAQKKLAPRIFELILTGELVTQMQNPGQFLHLLVPGGNHLLRRPISLANIDQKEKTCTLIYRVEGCGTQIFSKMKAGETLDVLGPLGNGFEIEDLHEGEMAFVIGGGIGTPPMYELAKHLKEKNVQVINLLGYASKEVMFYQEKFEKLGTTYVSTDDGSFGLHGHVGQLIDKALEEFGQPTAVYACGANGLLKAVDVKFEQHKKAYISMEARMACGVGACYACVVPLKNDESKNLKVCDQGPVFETGKVVI